MLLLSLLIFGWEIYGFSVRHHHIRHTCAGSFTLQLFTCVLCSCLYMYFIWFYFDVRVRAKINGIFCLCHVTSHVTWMFAVAHNVCTITISIVCIKYSRLGKTQRWNGVSRCMPQVKSRKFFTVWCHPIRLVRRSTTMHLVQVVRGNHAIPFDIIWRERRFATHNVCECLYRITYMAIWYARSIYALLVNSHGWSLEALLPTTVSNSAPSTPPPPHISACRKMHDTKRCGDKVDGWW